jgi:hypothetical protein
MHERCTAIEWNTFPSKAELVDLEYCLSFQQQLGSRSLLDEIQKRMNGLLIRAGSMQIPADTWGLS